MRLRVLEDKEEISNYKDHIVISRALGRRTNSRPVSIVLTVSVDIGKGMNVGQEGYQRFLSRPTARRIAASTDDSFRDC